MRLINHALLKKGWKFFDIMHKNRKVARIYEDGHSVIYYSSFMPYNLYLENGETIDFDTRFNNLNNFFCWCSSRVMEPNRKHVKEILNSIGATQSQTIQDRAAIATTYHGVNLLDVYWIKGYKENVSFKDINIYEHSLSDAFVDVSLRGKTLTANNEELHNPKDQAADIFTPGVAPKAWIRRDGAFYLLKDGDERDVSSELLASKIVECFDISSVKYDMDYFQGTKVSKSEIITSLDLSIVSMRYIEIYCANKGKNTIDFVLSKDAYGFHMMNIVDYLIGNTDRHYGNWGFYVNNKNNKLGKLYPLMDFNKSFLSYSSIDGSICQAYLGRSISQKDAAILGVKAIGLNQIKKIQEDWFDNESIKEMFFKRLEFLKNI